MGRLGVHGRLHHEHFIKVLKKGWLNLPNQELTERQMMKTKQQDLVTRLVVYPAKKKHKNLASKTLNQNARHFCHVVTYKSWTLHKNLPLQLHTMMKPSFNHPHSTGVGPKKKVLEKNLRLGIQVIRNPLWKKTRLFEQLWKKMIENLWFIGIKYTPPSNRLIRGQY